MNIAAFVISLLAGLISFLQGGCATGVGAIGTGLGSRVGRYDGARIAREGASMGGAGALVVLAALLAIIGGSFALPRKKVSYWLLAVSSGSGKTPRTESEDDCSPASRAPSARDYAV